MEKKNKAFTGLKSKGKSNSNSHFLIDLGIKKVSAIFMMIFLKNPICDMFRDTEIKSSHY